MTKCVMYQLARLALIPVEGKQKTDLDINVPLWLGKALVTMPLLLSEAVI